MPKQSTEQKPVEPERELEPEPERELVKVNVLGYDVELPPDYNVAQIHAFVRALKLFHKQHRFSYDITITLPSWRPGLLKDL